MKLCRIMLISSLQNWWTVERSLVGSTPNPKKPRKASKALRGFLSKFHTLQESHLVYGYTVILSVVLTVFLYAGCRSPYGTRGAVEMAYRLGQLAGQVCR